MKWEKLRLVYSYIALMALSGPAWAACDNSQPNQKPTSGYEIKGDQVVDKTTGLIWSRCSVGQRWEQGKGCTGDARVMTWEEAMNLKVPGWRMPTLEELKTLVSPRCKKPTINEEAFPGMQVEKLLYWSSTPNNRATSWTVDFFEGTSEPYNSISTPTPAAVRLVRTGQ